ncbi:MAG: ribosome recycling factor, partial [Oscillospiraceae bacterium]|nr:ribosome recycling factor [Oscillospiraceae bacterium]
GTPTPINQMAGVSVPEPRLLVIQPWDASALKLIEKAIQASDLGVNPVNDGKVLRITFPQPTEERRKELSRQVRKEGEDAKVAIRNIRRDALDDLKKQKKEGLITEDDLANAEKDTQKATDKYCKEVDEMVKVKENEIMAI